jgi:hypothetical protein
VHQESSGGAGVLPGPPGESGVAIPPDERISSQENNPATAILPEERRQQNLSLNDDPPSMTENALPGVKEEAGKSPGASIDASVSLLRGIP